MTDNSATDGTPTDGTAEELETTDPQAAAEHADADSAGPWGAEESEDTASAHEAPADEDDSLAEQDEQPTHDEDQQPPHDEDERSRTDSGAADDVMGAERPGTFSLFVEPATLEAGPPITMGDPDQKASPPAAASPFGLLFQAPDLTDVPARPKRRRATSGQGAAASWDERPAGAEGSADEGRATDQGAAPSSGETTAGKHAEPTPDPPAAPEGSSTDDQDTSPDDQGPASEDRDSTDDNGSRGRRRRRGGKGRRGRDGAKDSAADQQDLDTEQDDSTDAAGSAKGDQERPPGADSDEGEDTGSKRRRRRRRGEGTERGAREEVSGVQGSTRLEAKRQRRREGREAGRRRTIISEAEFLARRESVERVMVVRGMQDRTQIGVLEDGVLVEHYVSRSTQATMAGNVYLGRVQNVLPSMEAAFVDVGKGRNAVLYAGEVNWDAAGMQGEKTKRIENALSSGESVLAQVTKDPIGHKGARLSSQVSLPGRYLVYVPNSSMTGISRKLPDTERSRLKKILKEVVPNDAGVIVRTAAEGASEAELKADVERLTALWERIEAKAKSASSPALLHGEPDMTVRVIRDVFNEDFTKLIVSGDAAWKEVSAYIDTVAPDLADRVQKWTGEQDVFAHHRVSEGLAKAMDRKVWLPSGGSLVIDRTEAMTVVDVNTGKFVGSGGNLEETVTKNNIEAAEEIVRQLRLRDIGGIIVIDFIDMVLESNRELVVRRLLECLGRDRTKHQVAEVTSLGLVQMTRKRVGAGLIEVFSEECAHCDGRGILVQPEPIDKPANDGGSHSERGRGRKGRGQTSPNGGSHAERNVLPTPNPTGPTPAQIAAAAHAAALQSGSTGEAADATAKAVVQEVQSSIVVVDPAPADATTGDGGPAEGAADDTSAAHEQPVETQRPRRKRGRVVAAAGPPGSTPVEVDPSQTSGLVSADSSR